HGKPVPVTETGLPSYLASVTLSIFDPSALSPFAVILTPPDVDSRVTVRFVIAGTPGAAFDFAGLYFHVPSVLSAPSAIAAMATNTVGTARNLRIICLICLSPVAGLRFFILAPACRQVYAPRPSNAIP